MKTEAGALALVSDTAAAAARTTPAPAVPAPKAPAPATNVRLVIEEDQASGMFIYKTLDSTTGEVLLQLPREEVLKAIQSGAYVAGDVFKTKA